MPIYKSKAYTASQRKRKINEQQNMMQNKELSGKQKSPESSKVESGQVSVSGNSKRAQIFDWACKMMMTMSHKSMINFINGLFGKAYPQDSKITFLSTESVRTDMSRFFADFLLSIKEDKYHIEFQLKKDETIALRVFEYCFEEAKKSREEDGNEITLRFAQTKVVYLQKNRNIPEKYTVRFQMPTGETFRYEVPVIQLLAKSIEEIAEEGLVLLLPLYQLKMRGIRKMMPEQRSNHIEEFKAMIGSIKTALDKALADGIISEGDYAKLADVLGTLYHYLFSDMNDMKEVGDMVEEKFTSWFEEMAEKVRQKSMQEGRQEGRQEGIREGRQEGIREGRQEGMRVTYLLAKNPNLSDEELNRQTGYDIENIRKIREALMELA